MTAPCVQDHGLLSRIPGTFTRMTTFVEAYHRLGGDLEVLQTGFHIEPAQLHAAMAFYCANKELFDAENERFLQERKELLSRLPSGEQYKSLWADFPPPEGEEATDEEMDAMMEELS